MTKATFIVSLDFELHWGRFDKVALRGNEPYYHNARKAIPEILRLFEKYRIEATWATVGMLFAENWEEWNYYRPDVLPEYHQQQFSAYHWETQNVKSDIRCLFAPDLIKLVSEFPGQEIGSHTFSHYYTMERGQDLQAFRADLRAAQRIAIDKLGFSLKSLVFPRNQLNVAYSKVCLEEGFGTIRTNPKDWFWKDTQKENLAKKLFRTGDSFFQLGQKTSYPLDQLSQMIGLPLEIPASRMYRLYPKLEIFSRRRLARIKNEMTQAAKNGEAYHLWWHPHNFGNDLSKNLCFLEEILKHFEVLSNRFDMESLNMGSIYNGIKIPPLEQKTPFEIPQVKVG